MELLIAELSRYVILILFAIYTFTCFRAFAGKTTEGKERVFRAQRMLTVLIHVLCSAILILEYKELRYGVLFALELAFYLGFVKIYQIFYRGLSKLILNNMMMCMMIGFIMLGRLNYDYALRQLIMAAAAMGLCLFVPFFIERFTIWEKLGWQYALAGILLLLLVFVIGVEHYGARNWISFAGIALQPSEFVKIIYVFFIAALLSKTTQFRHIVVITAVAAVYVIILVAERDLGAALIYFVTYLVMLYVASMQPWYLVAGLGAGAVASVVAYRMFTHVQNRVIAFSDPWNHIEAEGYQVCQSLFAIGTGGLFGMGLGQGLPGSVPVVESDFIFSAISEEMGVIFSVCLILVYISSYIMFVNIAMKMKKRFYKLTAFGLSVVFIFQVFLCIGGVTKFIPSTGVTLPLISYGGSSIITTIIIFSIIQGMYVLNGREEEARLEREEGNGVRGGAESRKTKKRRKKR
ncbi:MAG: FtsW/RodA/SpoVE family cell cycle protein [Lachnospiraceae bacterium]|nr:FtsW/RodA/SpoVE family cell cycle protein [Lachnospiraceae bacterium]